jgi:hypothetical protein
MHFKYLVFMVVSVSLSILGLAMIVLTFANQQYLSIDSRTIDNDDEEFISDGNKANNNNNAFGISEKAVVSLSTINNGNATTTSPSSSSSLASSLLKILTVNSQDSSNPIGGATFLITPNPYNNSNRSSLAITDNGTNDQDNAAGTVLLSNVIPRQYIISEVIPPVGFVKDSSIKTVNIDPDSKVTTITFIGQPVASGPNRLEYTARFICGTIIGEDGPLRPGRYNSDINIFNRQSFPISFLWNAVPSGIVQRGQEIGSSNFRLQTLGPGDSVSISCKDIRSAMLLYSSNITNNKENFFEGVMTISVELDPSIQGAISSSSVGQSGTIISSPLYEGTGTEPNTNVLSVDAIYTVNALDVASREIVLQLIDYSINKQDENGKIPRDIIAKTLSVTVPIRTNETVNPDKQVRSILTKEFSLNPSESQKLEISIRNLSLGVGALDDNHALSLQRINAYQPSPAS